MERKNIPLNTQITRIMKHILPTSSTRYALNSVYIDIERKEIAVTNGRELLVLSECTELKNVSLPNVADMTTGLYQLNGCVLCPTESSKPFPTYHDNILSESCRVFDTCKGIQSGIIQLMVTKQIGIDVFCMDKSIRALQAISPRWTFYYTTSLPTEKIPYTQYTIMAQTEALSYKIQHIYRGYVVEEHK